MWGIPKKKWHIFLFCLYMPFEMLVVMKGEWVVILVVNPEERKISVLGEVKNLSKISV